MKEIKGKNIKNVEYQFSRPISAMDIYGSISEFNSVYDNALLIIDSKNIKRLEKEYMKEVKKLKDYKQEKDHYKKLMYGFVSMRINGALDTKINQHTKYIDIKVDLYNNKLYAVGKIDTFTMSPKFDYEEKYGNKIAKALKRRMQRLLGKSIKEMLS